MKGKLRIGLAAIALTLLAGDRLQAQSPGGVAAAAWYRADAPGSLFTDAGSTAASNNSSVQQWKDAQGLGRNLIQTSAGAKPIFSNATTLANFNPTVTFDGSNDFMQYTAAGTNLIDRANGTLYTAGYVNKQKGSGFAGFHSSMDFPGLHMFTNNKLLFFTSGGPGYQGQSVDVMQAQRYFSAGSGWENGVGGSVNHALASVSLNGIRSDITGSKINNVNTGVAYNDFRIGADSNYGAFSGQVNEVLVFENKLTSDEMDRVETYLAVKYGTTYANGTRDYRNSAGAAVWTAASNAGYISNIAGIANDGALQQKQSWSTNPGQQVLISTTGLTETNAANGTALTAGQYLVWGDNGLAKVPTVATAAFPSVSHHFQAIWKVQNSGTVGTVRVAWPKGLKSLSLIQSSDPTIGAGDVLTPMTTEITINNVDYIYADVTLANGQYFTFAAKVAAPGGVTAGLTQWYRADEGLVKVGGDGTSVTTWTDFARGTVSGKIATAPVPVYRQGATNYFNFNPGVNFTTVQQMLGNITTQTLENTSFDIFTLTKEGMSGTRYFNIGMNNTAFGGANWDQPGLYTSGNIATRNSTGGGLGILNPGNIDFSTTIPSIMYHTFTNTSIRKGVNGAGLGTQWNVSARGQATGGHIFGSNGGTNPPGGDDWGFTGHIGEVVVYGGGNLSATDRNKVDTYLAIKYGITLPAGVNYLSSNGNVVWDATTNSTYHKNVAGITNDESSALNQKQSISVNKGQQVIISTTGLTHTNIGNGTPLADGQYLIWGDNGLSKTLSASFNFPSVPTLNLRFAAIWKVQNTGTVQTVRVAWPSGVTGLTLIQSADATIDDSDTRTDMTANSVTVNGVSYNYADVTLSNGQYFTFAGFVSGPGNVASAAWYRADGAGQQFSDAGINAANDGQTLQQWNEYKGTGYNLVQASSGNRPTFSNTTTLANFNPTVTFPGSQWMRYTAPAGVNVIDRANGTIYAAGFTNVVGQSGIAGFHSTMDYPGLHTSPLAGGNRNLLFFTGGPGYQGISTNIFTNKSYFTIGSGWQNGEGSPTANYAGATVSLNGNRKVYAGTNEIQNVVINDASRDFQIGQDVGWGGLNGQLNEVVVFEQRLSEDEMNRVETYMAIKYGTTYAAGTKDYVNSSSGTVWSTTVNNGHHYNIAGIARDDMGSLFQKQSWSTNPGTQVLISTTGLENTNAGNTGVVGNGQFLIWGDNGLAKTPSVAIAGINGVNYHFASIWKAQNTNSMGTVRVAWPLGLTNLKLIQSADATINSSDVITDMAGTQTVNGVDYAYADVTISNGQYFTFAAFIQGPGGVTTNLSHWYRADKLTQSGGDGTDVTRWTDFTSGVISDQLGESDLPKFKKGGATYFNFNPGINFTAANQKIGNITERTLSALDYDVFSLTKEGMTGTRFFNIGMDNTTFNGLNWDQPGFYPDGAIVRRTSTGAGNYLANPGGVNFSTTSPNIMYHTFGNTTLSKGLNGAPNGTSASHSAIGPVTGGHIFGANSGDATSGDDGGFIGNIGELVIYGAGTISAAERNKVDSYLAIKYGVTLNNTNNYTTSGGVTVWDATANSGYYNNVAGVGNDFVSALHQKQSRSQHTNTNNQVIIGLGDIAETNAANVNTLSDGQFLIWGDNGNTQAMTNTASTYTEFEYAGSTSNGRRMKRVWKIQNTNNVSNDVLIRFPVASVSTTGNPSFAPNEACADYVIIFADDEAFTTNVTVKGLTVNGTDYDVAHNFPNGASYFTYGKVVPFNQGTVYLPTATETTNVSSNACDVGTWKYFRQTSDNSQKLMGITGYTPTAIGNLAVTITPEGTSFDNGTRKTNLMPRITTVANSGTSPLPTGGKVRIYYSLDELNATTVSNENVHGWFKYEGSAEDITANVYTYGKLDATKTTQLTPDASGVEDGVNYVEFHNVTVFSSFLYLSTTEENALPVTLTYFNAAKEGNVASLTWGTTEEVNNKGFEIQRSANAREWNGIGFVDSRTAGGNSMGTLAYNFTDASPSKGTNYYRLKQIDADGSFQMSTIVSLRFDDGKGSLFVYPNPVMDGKLSLGLTRSGVYTLSVYNISGVEVLKLNQSATTLDVSRLPAGVYVMKVTYANGETHNKSFVVK